MASKTIYKTAAGQAEMLEIYDRQVARLGLPVEDRIVSTRFGDTHLLVCGPKDGRPLVSFHGGNTTNPATLSWFKPLAQKYRIYAPDTIGHPGKSAAVRLSPKTDDYGHWVADVLDGLQLKQAVVAGGSYGAGIVLNAAAVIPERLEKLVLYVPSGIVSIPFSTMFFRLLFPLGLYYLAPSRASLERELRPMFVQAPIPEDVLEVTEATFRNVNIEPEMPRNVTREEMARLKAPVLVITAERDLLFPAKAVIKRAKEIFPNLVAAEIIPDSPHFISPGCQGGLCARIDQFIEQGI